MRSEGARVIRHRRRQDAVQTIAELRDKETAITRWMEPYLWAMSPQKPSVGVDFNAMAAARLQVDGTRMVLAIPPETWDAYFAGLGDKKAHSTSEMFAAIAALKAESVKQLLEAGLGGKARKLAIATLVLGDCLVTPAAYILVEQTGHVIAAGIRKTLLPAAQPQIADIMKFRARRTVEPNSANPLDILTAVARHVLEKRAAVSAAA